MNTKTTPGRARWTKSIPDLAAEGRQKEVGNYYTANQVSAETGLSANTITDALSRRTITARLNALRPVSRPVVRFGNVPLYSRQQIDEVLAIQDELAGRSKHHGGAEERLPTIDPLDADELDLVSTREIAELSGKHEQTIRLWKRSREDFPKPTHNRARRSGHAGVPEVVFPRKDVVEWLVRNGYLNEGDAAA